MTPLAKLSTSLSTLFTSTAVTLGWLSRLFRGQRDLPPTTWLKLLSWVGSTTRVPLWRASRCVWASSAKALHQRMPPEARHFFELLLAEALKLIHAAKPARLRLLARFSQVITENCTTITLPPDCAIQWRGCGGSHPDKCLAAMKVLVRWELRTG